MSKSTRPNGPVAAAPVERAEERNFRPSALTDFVGQAKVKKTLAMMLRASQKRGQALEHVVFFGPPGLGKTTLAAIVAAEMGAQLHEVSAPALFKTGDLAAVLSIVQAKDVLFLDEVHRLRAEIAELLYGAMENFRLSIVLDRGDPPITLPLPMFTLIGATTDYGLLPGPLRARFGHSFALSLYTEDELRDVVLRAGLLAGIAVEEDAAREIARRSRGTPRVALRLFRRTLDLATDRDCDRLDAAIVRDAMSLLGVDALGLEDADRRYLHTLAQTYNSGPVGPKSLAASSGLDLATIEQVIEPWLLQAGLIARTRYGRALTPLGHVHLGGNGHASGEAFELIDEDDFELVEGDEVIELDEEGG
ncbi:MAG TPA: Holliday junction branch migration DNA helicase RuvB [Anaerolineae bacterium]|nr:Holliday junction branch migration DNA helicase RuvB [Anaerolineae bacterium]